MRVRRSVNSEQPLNKGCLLLSLSLLALGLGGCLFTLDSILIDDSQEGQETEQVEVEKEILTT